MSFEVPNIFIQSAKKGDKQAFGKLIDSCSEYVYAVALKLIGDKDEAQDAAQESFIKVWEKLGSYKSHFRFTTWLYKIVTNTCLDRLRKRKRESEIFKKPSNIESLDWSDAGKRKGGFEEQQFIEFIRVISGKLSQKQHSVFVLHDLEELTQDEISKILGMTKGRVKSNLYYARQALRQLLRQVDQKKITSSHEM